MRSSSDVDLGPYKIEIGFLVSEMKTTSSSESESLFEAVAPQPPEDEATGEHDFSSLLRTPSGNEAAAIVKPDVSTACRR